MKNKKKLSLDELEVKSFVTSLNSDLKKTIQAGNNGDTAAQCSMGVECVEDSICVCGTNTCDPVLCVPTGPVGHACGGVSSANDCTGQGCDGGGPGGTGGATAFGATCGGGITCNSACAL